MKNLQRFLAKCGVILLLVNLTSSFLPGYLADNIAPNAYAEPAVYYWEAGEWSECDAPCDGGTQTRVVVCKDGSNQVVADENCDLGSKPATVQACNIQACPVCGDSNVDPGEQCDDGDDTDASWCNADCSAFTSCGDGTVQVVNGQQESEECDDGGTDSGDGCSASCVVEYCGDGIANNNGEACDNGQDGNPMESASCNANCTYPTCGDGILNVAAGEQCDDSGLCTVDDSTACTSFNDCAGGGCTARSGDGCSDECNFEGPITRVFVTSTAYDGNLGGVAGADAKCQAQADAGQLDLEGDWKAIIEDTTQDLDDVMPDRPYVRVDDGALVAQSKTDLLNGSILSPISITENGDDYEADVWTGWDVTASKIACYPDWSTNNSSYFGEVGISTAINQSWIANRSDSCFNSRHLYCYEVGDIDPPTVTPLGNGSEPYQLPFIPSQSRPTLHGATLIFSEELNADSKSAVVSALSSASNRQMSFIWGTDGNSNKLRLSYEGSDESDTATFASDVIAYATDLSNNTTQDPLLLIDSAGGTCVEDLACLAPCGLEEGFAAYSPDNGIHCFTDYQCTPEYICESGVNPAYIFITSSATYNGDLGGEDGADIICTDIASGAGLSGTWRALLSTTGPTTEAYEKLPDNKPFFLLNGQQVANIKADLLDGSIMNPINITENGTLYTHSGLVWTGTNYVGAVSGVMMTCDNWLNSESILVVGTYGSADSTDASWINVQGSQACDASLALYCFSGDSDGLGGQGTCGNGNAEQGEQCDNGGLCANNQTQCTTNVDCMSAGGTCTPRNEDGCSAICETEGQGNLCEVYNDDSEACDNVADTLACFYDNGECKMMSACRQLTPYANVACENEIDPLNCVWGEGTCDPGTPVCGNNQCEAGETPFDCSSDCSTGGGFTCGDNIADGDNPVVGGMGQPCDGTDLRQYTCDSLPDAPFIGGTLSCNQDCMSFDTSLCTVDQSGSGGQCILNNGVIDGTNPFEGGQGEVCDGSGEGSVFWEGMNTCGAFGYESGELSCSSCNFDFTSCFGGGFTPGTGQITVNLKNEAGDDYAAESDIFVVVQCGNSEIDMGDQGAPPTGPTQTDSFSTGGMIRTGQSSTIITGIPTPNLGQVQDPNPYLNPCLVFLSGTPGLVLGSAYNYTGGRTGEAPGEYIPYSANTEFNLPMPPNAKYAQVKLGDPNLIPDPAQDEAVVDLKVGVLTYGDLSGYICLDADGSTTCDAGEYLEDMEISIFPLGTPPDGFQSPEPFFTTPSGDYIFQELPGGDYMIQAFGEKMYFGTVTVNGDTEKNLVISLGNTLNLTVRTSFSDGCWNTDEGGVRYSFYPLDWNFSSRPVFGEAQFRELTDEGRGTYSLAIQGFGDGDYNWQMEIPGCMNIYGTPDTLVNVPESNELSVSLSAGITISGIVLEEDGITPIPNFSFGAQTVFDPEQPNIFGGFVGTNTDGNGNFALSGMTAGGWTFSSFDGGVAGSQRSFAANAGSLNPDGVYEVTGSANDVVLIMRSDKRVNITVSDGLNLITNAMIDIQCVTGKYVHLGHSNEVWTFLPPGDTCNFNVHARTGTYMPLQNYPVVITAGSSPQDISLTLQDATTNRGVYEDSSFKSDKTTTYPGGKVTYTGKLVVANAASLAGKTVTFTYPAAASGGVVTSTSAGTCTGGSGTITCTIPGGYADTEYIISNELTVDSAYTGDNISTSLNVGSTNIGNVFVEVVNLTISGPNVVRTGESFTVYGESFPNATVTLSYLNSAGAETTVGSTVMDPGSTWYSFSGVSIGSAGEYTLKATAVGEGATSSVTRLITVGGSTPDLQSIDFSVNGNLWSNNPLTGIPSGQLFEGSPFTISVTFTDNVTGVTGSFGGSIYDFTDMGGVWQFVMPSGWTGYGNNTFDVTASWDDDNNGGTPDVSVPYGPASEVLVLIDPSGYVYDTTDANRIAGATATVYQLVAGSAHLTLGSGTTITSITGPDTNLDLAISTAEEGVASGFAVGKISGCGDGTTLNTTLCTWSSWNATPSGQTNPLITDADGKYGWNVPQGWYRVSFSKAGAYSTSYSRDVYVPPAETTLDLNIGAYDIAAPTVLSTNPPNGATLVARNAQPVITFSEPMLAGTINTTNIKLIDVQGGGSVNVGITVTYDALNNTATLAPTAPPLAALNDYIIRITTGVTDDSSNALAAQVEKTFQTAAATDVLPPTSAATPTTTTFIGSRTVALGADDGGGAGTCTNCTIYYTIDGTAPTTSSAVYSGTQFTFTSTKTLKFFAKDAAGNCEGGACLTPTIHTETYTLTSAPAVPNTVAASSLTNGYISLTWGSVTGATSYKVYRSTTSGSYGAALATGVTGALYSDTTAVNSTTYYYKVVATNAVGDSGLSAEVNATSTITTINTVCGNGTCEAGESTSSCPADCGSGGGGGGNGTPPASISKFSSTVTGEQTYIRTVEIASSLITITESGEKSADLTGDRGIITLMPAKNSDLSATIPSSTTLTAPANWDGKISPPVVQSVSSMSSIGEPITGTTDKLMRDDVAAVIKIGAANNVRLDFNNPVTLEVPVDLPDGSLVSIYFSQDGNTWEGMATATVINGTVMFTTTHFTYFAVAQPGAGNANGTVSIFNDIAGHWAEDFINQIAALGIVTGRSEGMFAPNDSITRAELTKMAVMAFKLERKPASTSSFTDVKTDDWYSIHIEAAAKAGWVQGYESKAGAKVFNPNWNINRAEALKILLEAAGFDTTGDIDTSFKDTDPKGWYMRYVNFAFKNGIVSGYEDGKFGPGKNITRAEAAKVIMKILDLAK